MGNKLLARILSSIRHPINAAVAERAKMNIETTKALFNAYLGRGWYRIEENQTNAWIWSMNRAEIRISKKVFSIELKFLSSYFKLTGMPQNIKISIDGRPYRTLQARQGEEFVRIDCNNNKLITLEVDTLRPYEYLRSRDGRDLGICLERIAINEEMKLPGLKSRVSFGPPGFAGLPPLRSGRHSSPGLKPWGFLAGLINDSAEQPHGISPTINALNPKGLPDILHIGVTTHCNLRCKMCAIPGYRVHIDDSMWQHILEAAQHTKMIKFLGAGEPFMHPRFVDYLENVDAVGVSAGFVTNGILVDPVKAQRIAGLKNLSWISVSIDSPDPKIYKSIRIGGKLSDAMRGLEYLVRESKSPELISVISVVMRSNIESLAKFPEILFKIGVKTFILNDMSDFGLGLKEEMVVNNDHDLEVINEVKSECMNRNISLILTHTIPTPLVGVVSDGVNDEQPPVRNENSECQNLGETPITKLCFDPWEIAYISADGNVYPCDAYDEAPVMGNIREKSFRDVWWGKRYTRFRRDLLYGRQLCCRNCPRRHSGYHPFVQNVAKIPESELLPDGSKALRLCGREGKTG